MRNRWNVDLSHQDFWRSLEVTRYIDLKFSNYLTGVSLVHLSETTTRAEATSNFKTTLSEAVPSHVGRIGNNRIYCYPLSKFEHEPVVIPHPMAHPADRNIMTDIIQQSYSFCILRVTDVIRIKSATIWLYLIVWLDWQQRKHQKLRTAGLLWGESTSTKGTAIWRAFPCHGVIVVQGWF